MPFLRVFSIARVSRVSSSGCSWWGPVRPKRLAWRLMPTNSCRGIGTMDSAVYCCTLLPRCRALGSIAAASDCPSCARSFLCWSKNYILCFCQPCFSDLFRAAYLRRRKATLDWNLAGLLICQSTELSSARGASKVEFLRPLVRGFLSFFVVVKKAFSSAGCRT